MRRRARAIALGRSTTIALIIVLNLVLALLPTVRALGASDVAERGAAAPDRFLVRFKPGTPAAEIAALDARNGVS